MKYLYKGQIVTASSKEEAIKVLANTDFLVSGNENKKVFKEKDEVTGKYFPSITLVRRGKIVSIENYVGDLEWKGKRNTEEEAKELFNKWFKLTNDFLKNPGKNESNWDKYISEITKEKSVYNY